MDYFFSLEMPQKKINLTHHIQNVNLYRFNWHKATEIFFLLSGKAELCVDGRTYILEEDDLLLINSNEGHASMGKAPGSIAMALRFDPEIFISLSENYTNMVIKCISNKENRYETPFKKLRYYAAQMMHSARLADCTSKLIQEGAFLMLLATLLSFFPLEYPDKKITVHDIRNQETIKLIVNFLEENYNRKITLDEMAKLSRYNRTYASSFFKKNVGISFYDYLTRVRLRHALQELNYTSKSLTKIAVDNGFPDLKSFSVYFKEIFNKSPSCYRKQIESNPNAIIIEGTHNILPIGSGCVEEKLKEYLHSNLNYPKEEPEKNKIDIFLNKVRSENIEIYKLCQQILNILESSSTHSPNISTEKKDCDL